jgi:uncharacterized protein YkwD
LSLDHAKLAKHIGDIAHPLRALVAATAVAGALTFAVALGDGPAAPAGAAASPTAQAAGKAKRTRTIARMEEGIRRCANSRREAAGLRPLATGAGISRAARFHAQSMSKGGYFDHIDGRGRSPGDRIAIFAGRGAFSMTGENIAAGPRGPRSVCRAWMRSPSHHANILKPGYTHIGAGFASGGRYRRYFVMDLGRAAG